MTTTAKEHRFTIIRNADEYSDEPRTVTAWNDEFQRAKEAAIEISASFTEEGDFLYFDDISDDDLEYIIDAMELYIECDDIVIDIEYYAKEDLLIAESEDGRLYFEKETEDEIYTEFTEQIKGFYFDYETNWFAVNDRWAFIGAIMDLPGDFYFNFKKCPDGIERCSFSGTGRDIDISVLEDIATETVVIEKMPLF